METAQGIISVVTANMAKAIRVISVQRGHDPRDYTLMAFGGAGPLHAARLARELDMKRVLVPRNAGHPVRLGLLLTDLRADFATSLLPGRPASRAEVADAGSTASKAQADATGSHEGDRRRDRRSAAPSTCATRAELRARGPVPDGPVDAATLEALAGLRAAHQQRYGFVAEGEPVQLVTLPRRGHRPGAQGRVRPQPDAGPDASARSSAREVWCPRPAASSTARSMIATGWRPATASPGRPSSSRWTPPPSCCRA
jgi:N-methylhydantoinase A